MPEPTPRCALWQHITTRGLRTVAVMGMSKNTGKTVCLNHLIAQAQATHTTLGITSIGRDGEARDEVFSIPKPPVRVVRGTLIATASDTLLRAGVRTRQIGRTGVGSPLGEILIVQATADGEMEVAGASRGHDQHEVIAQLRQCGAQHVLLDGALGRSHHASPAMADGVVLATGAVVGGGIGDVLRKTRERLAILGIPTVPPDLAWQVRKMFDDQGASLGAGVGVWHRDGTCLFHAPIATLNAADALLGLRAAGIGTIAVAGAVGRLLWQAMETLLGRHPGLTLVVADGTRLFIEAAHLAAFRQQGGHLYAMRGIQLIGVTLNPHSPLGGSFDAHAFLAQARSQLPGHTVMDVMLPLHTTSQAHTGKDGP